MDRPLKELPVEVANIMPMPGHVFEGKYRIVNLIGAGGFARVFHARFEDVARDVALKVLVPETANPQTMYGEELVQRFHREARAVSELRSPNTITLHDFGRTRSGLLYMIFEYVDGQPLDRLVKSNGPMAAERVVHILRQILGSLREAHAVGMLHRDIKPANVMVFDYLDQRDLVKLLDFGIAKSWTHDSDGNPISEDLTEVGTVMGTPRYMSPEQIVGQRLSPASDIYSLGLVVFEMLCGSPAAPQTQKSEVVRRHLGPEPFLLPSDLPVPGGFRQLVVRMTSKDIGQRFHSVDDVLAALEQWDEPDQMAATQASGAPIALMQAQIQQPQSVAFVPQPGFSTPTTGAQHHATPQSGAPYGDPSQPMQQAPPTGPIYSAAPQPTEMGQRPMVVATPKPTRLAIRIVATPTALELDVPIHMTKRTMAIAGAACLPFLLAMTIGSGTLIVIGIVGVAFAASLIFQTFRLRLSVETGYELSHLIFNYERAKRGPMVSVVRFEARGTDEGEDTVLKLVTHEGEFTVANAFPMAENLWIANEANAWVSQVRNFHPHPTG